MKLSHIKKSWRDFILSLALVSYYNVIIAQVPNVDNLEFKQFTVRDGLPTNNIRYAQQDERGFMWFATFEGLVRYDGFEFKTYLPPEEHTREGSTITFCFTLTSENKIWIHFAGRGLFMFDIFDESFREIPFPRSDHNSDQPTRVRAIKYSNNKIWVGGDNGLLYRFDEKSLTAKIYDIKQFILNNHPSEYFSIQDIEINATNTETIFVAISNHIVEIKEDHMNLIETVHSPRATSLCLFSNGDTLWLGKWGGGLISYNINAKKFDNFLVAKNPEKIHSMVENVLVDIKMDPSGKFLWIASYDRGVILFDLELGKFHEVSSLDVDIINEVFLDNDRNIWIMSQKDGIFLHAHNTSIFQNRNIPELKSLGQISHVQKVRDYYLLWGRSFRPSNKNGRVPR